MDMKILYLLKREPDGTMNDILSRHRSAHEVTVVDLRTEKDYERIVDLIRENDRVITW